MTDFERATSALPATPPSSDPADAAPSGAHPAAPAATVASSADPKHASGFSTPADLTPTRVPWGAVVVFAVLACGLAWLVQLPVWTSGQGLGSPLFLPLTSVMMFTPAIAGLLVTVSMIRPSSRRRYLGITPLRPLRRTIGLSLLFIPVWLVLAFAAFFLAVALCWTAADLSMGGVTEALTGEMTLQAYLLVTFLTLPVAALASSVLAFGEELGWRGFLTTALAPLGFWRAALFNGLLWGVWHAPVILLGYNFARPHLGGLALMCGFTLCVGVLLQWARYQARNVWPAVVGHGALNATATAAMIFATDDLDVTTGTLLGVPGWVVMGLVVLALVGTGSLGRRLPRPLVPAPAPRSPDAD